jgi:hypothetical protein
VCGKCKRNIVSLIEQHAGANGHEMEG